MTPTREALALILQIQQRHQELLRSLWFQAQGPEHNCTALKQVDDLIGELAALAYGRGELLMPSGFFVPDVFKTVHGFTEALGGWIEARRKKRNPPTGKAIQLLINRLSSRPKEAIAALELATERGWSTVKWEWFDKEQPVTGQRNGEYPEAAALPIRNVA
jgi:hypothetical protein